MKTKQCFYIHKINEELILDLVEQLNGKNIDISNESNGFKYLAHELYFLKKCYRIVLTYCEEDFLGIINTFRVKEKKHDEMAKKRRY